MAVPVYMVRMNAITLRALRPMSQMGMIQMGYTNYIKDVLSLKIKINKYSAVLRSHTVLM